MEEVESDALLKDLFDHCEQERFIQRHVWCEGDVVIWDNRRMMHCALEFPPDGPIRHMHRTTVKGDRPFLRPGGAGEQSRL